MTTGLGAGIEIGPIAAALDRHEQRRRRGLPTVSALAGPIGLGLREARSWAEGRGRSIVRVFDSDLDAALTAWAARVDAEHDLAHAFIARLARGAGQPEADLGARLRRMTPFERDAFLDEALADAAGTGLDVVGRHLLARSRTNLDVTGLARPLLARALLELVDEQVAPVLLIAAGPPELAARLAEIEPALTVLLLADPAALGAYLAGPVESRARALLRESVVAVPALGEDGLRGRLERARPGLADTLADPLARLVADGASEELADLFVVTARAVDEADGGDPEAGDRARSAAERFLFERLESLPATAGLFRLNARPGFAFVAGHPMEVDLLAAGLKLAIDVDGYRHFQDADAYRRDRRKDLELQRRGYLVVRVLAEDVVRRLEEILSTILDAVAHQSRPTPPRGA